MKIADEGKPRGRAPLGAAMALLSNGGIGSDGALFNG
jgi:hypothetical protein